MILNFTIIIIALILFSFSVHEAAHAWVAYKLGDHTAKLENRISLNPANHWDPIGTTLLVILLILRSFGLPIFAFGWGKPVPINDRHFKNPRRDLLIASLSGPFSNILLALAFAFFIRLIPYESIFYDIFLTAVSLNFFLAIFNLIPLPPLDGSQILRTLVSDKTYYQIEQNSQIIMILVIALIFLAPGLISGLVSALVNLVT